MNEVRLIQSYFVLSQSESYVSFADGLVDELALSNPSNQLKLFFGDFDVLLVQFILDGPPPGRVLASLDELIQPII